MQKDEETEVKDDLGAVASDVENGKSKLTVEDSSSELAKALEEAQKKAQDNWDLFLRTRADADNIRRRAVLDVENANKYGMEKFARELLAVVDSLDQGLTLIDPKKLEASDAPLQQGMVLTHKLLLDTLKNFGITLLDPLGQSFDPSRHEALSTQPSAEVEPNKVLVVLQKGFTLQDRLLRPARVIVSRAIEN